MGRSKKRRIELTSSHDDAIPSPAQLSRIQPLISGSSTVHTHTDPEPFQHRAQMPSPAAVQGNRIAAHVGIDHELSHNTDAPCTDDRRRPLRGLLRHGQQRVQGLHQPVSRAPCGAGKGGRPAPFDSEGEPRISLRDCTDGVAVDVARARSQTEDAELVHRSTSEVQSLALSAARGGSLTLFAEPSLSSPPVHHPLSLQTRPLFWAGSTALASPTSCRWAPPPPRIRRRR